MQAGFVESFFLEGEAGRMEALLNTGAEDAPAACLLCHPHPLYGGTMHNKVVFHAMKELNSFGLPVLRFNFRGVGASAGEHDGGHGEQNDIRLAMDWLARRFARPLLFAGFSFGAAVGLRAAVPDARVAALVALGLPVSAGGRNYTYGFLRESTKPKLLISGAQDEYASPEQLRELAATLAEPRRLVLVPGADHFFAGHLDEMRKALGIWLRETLPGV